MTHIYTLGETVMDILFKDGTPVAAKAGGSMLNASVTLGRLKIPVSFISEFGNDKVGDQINDFLNNNGVDTSLVYRYNDGKTAISLAYLDGDQNASYSFYKIYPAKRLDIALPPIKPGDIVMFGSYFGIAPEIRNTVMKILTHAKQQGALIIYDPNFRKSHLNKLEELRPYIKENFNLAHIIKGSDEDFENLFYVTDINEAFNKLEDNSKILIYTTGKDGAGFCSANKQFHIPSKQIEPVSTIGAGDNFNAGIAFSLLRNNILPADFGKISEDNWKTILSCGIDFASEVCLSYDNYISQHFSDDYLKILAK